MALYAISTLPLIMSLQTASSAKQCWFADGASGAGPVTQIKDWWDALNILGPNLRYFPKSEKCWIVVKPEKEASVRKTFNGTAIRVTVHVQKHFVATLGSREHLEEL